MEKYLVTIEFRYSQPPAYESCTTATSKKVCIGVFSDFEQACTEGNKHLKILESQFGLNPNYNERERFSSNTRLITDLGYLITPFSFFSKIETLKFDSIEESITNVMNCIKKYKEFKDTESKECRDV